MKTLQNYIANLRVLILDNSSSKRHTYKEDQYSLQLVSKTTRN